MYTYSNEHSMYIIFLWTRLCMAFARRSNFSEPIGSKLNSSLWDCVYNFDYYQLTLVVTSLQKLDIYGRLRCICSCMHRCLMCAVPLVTERKSFHALVKYGWLGNQKCNVQCLGLIWIKMKHIWMIQGRMPFYWKKFIK